MIKKAHLCLKKFRGVTGGDRIPEGKDARKHFKEQTEICHEAYLVLVSIQIGNASSGPGFYYNNTSIIVQFSLFKMNGPSLEVPGFSTPSQ